MICNKNLLCLNDFTFFDYQNTFFNKIIYKIAYLSLLDCKFKYNLINFKIQITQSRPVYLN